MRRYLVGAALAAAVGISGCGSDQLTTDGLSVTIVDALTGAPVAYEAVMIVSDGVEADTIEGHGGMPPEMAGEVTRITGATGQIGTFYVTILHPRYRTWHRSGVVVERADWRSPFDGSPLPKTTHIVAALEPL